MFLKVRLKMHSKHGDVFGQREPLITQYLSILIQYTGIQYYHSQVPAPQLAHFVNNYSTEILPIRWSKKPLLKIGVDFFLSLSHTVICKSARKIEHTIQNPDLCVSLWALVLHGWSNNWGRWVWCVMESCHIGQWQRRRVTHY